MPRFASYEEKGFGQGAVWFAGAVIHVPWEGAASIAPAELLTGPVALLSPMIVESSAASDCPGSSRLDGAIQRNRTSIVSGQGRLRNDGVFVVECVCAVEKTKELTADQLSRLYAGPLP
ncbi:MAG: hypothetical protein JO197_13210 [Acidobacteria bacterium]|nr:hypothetical protein [Acidobacteriota bacterium]MBV9477653.1 hypothetical protein [Acidobacteriota bacterium]